MRTPLLRFREATAASTMSAVQRTGTTADEPDDDEKPKPGDDATREAGKDCHFCEGSGNVDGQGCPQCDGTGKDTDAGPAKNTPAREAEPHPAKLHTLTTFREATPARTSTGNDGYAVTVIEEGLGNNQDGHYYTKEALREAVDAGFFEGLKSFGDHPSRDDERNRPERSVWDIAGYYYDAEFVEQGGTGKVRAVFVPVERKDRDVRGLVESAIAASARVSKPLIGISIDGGGTVEPGELPDGRVVDFVREFTHLASADLVTQAGAGGTFERRLVESLRGSVASRPSDSPNASKEVSMKPAELQEMIKAATAKLRESAKDGKTDEERHDAVKAAFATLSEVENAEVETEVQVREVEKPVAADKNVDADKLQAELEAAQVKLRETESTLRETKSENATYERQLLIGRVLRESKLADEDHKFVADDLKHAEDEAEMRRVIDRFRETEERITQKVRESIGGIGVIEGAGARTVEPADATDSRSFLESAGIPVRDPEPEQAAA